MVDQMAISKETGENMKYIITIGRFLLQCMYYLLWICPTQNKVVMISRQANEPSIDFKLIKEEIEKRNDGTKVILLCRTLDGGVNSSLLTKLGYVFHMFVQMYHLATSQICILDGYCIVASLLHHKKQLKVIQMWHSMGTMKKFGYSILDQEEGSSSKLAYAMRMHKNYDYYFASSTAYQSHLAAGFGCDEKKARIYPLPRVDLLQDKEYAKQKQAEIYQKHPILKDKKVILYAPTFRKDETNMQEAFQQLAKEVPEGYILVAKLHPLSKMKVVGEQICHGEGFSTFDMLFVADYMISDYSCVIYEALVRNIPLSLYAFDYDQYVDKRGFAIDYEKELYPWIEKDPKQIMQNIKQHDFNTEQLKSLKHKYIKETYHASKDIVDFLEQIKESSWNV